MLIALSNIESIRLPAVIEMCAVQALELLVTNFFTNCNTVNEEESFLLCDIYFFMLKFIYHEANCWLTRVLNAKIWNAKSTCYIS